MVEESFSGSAPVFITSHSKKQGQSAVSFNTFTWIKNSHRL